MLRPELFTDEGIEELVEEIYHNICKGPDGDCEHCSHKDEVEEGVCMADVTMDLWRRWKNQLDIQEVSRGRYAKYYE